MGPEKGSRMPFMNKKNSSILIGSLVLALAGFGAARQAPPAGYHLLKKIVIGGEGGWDYLALEGKSRLLFVSHGNAFEVVNVDTGAKLDAIPNLKGVHGVAFAPDRDRGYISNGRGNSVTVFELGTRKVLEEVPVSGKNPDSIMYEPVSGRVFTFNGATANTTAIDAATDKVVGTIDRGGKPEFAVHDGKGVVFVNNEDKSEVIAFDAKTLEIKKRWSIAPGEGPSGLAIDLKNKRLFSVCDKVMVVSDFENGKVVATVPIGSGPDAVRYDPGTGLVFSSNGEGTMTVIRQESADTYSVLETVKTAPRGRTMELDLKTHNVFIVTAEYGPAPAPTAEQPRPRPVPVPGTFQVLVFGK
jgi:DNA-binding beta-propeller fold protein YncE